MELRHLRYFLAVAREGNVTQAARTLHVSQPTLSRQLADLEAELGCALLVREPRGVTLTDDGVLLRKRAEEIVSLADRAELELRSADGAVAGEVWVGGGESRAMAAVAAAAARVSREHAGVRFHLHSGNADDVEERVAKGLLDFGVLLGREPDARFERLSLAHRDRWGLLVRRDDPLAGCGALALGELPGLPLIVSRQGHAATDRTDGPLGGLVANVRIVASYTLLYNASLLVEAGVGVALCLDGIIPAGVGTPFAFVPVDGLPEVSAAVVWRRFQPLSRAAAAFLSELRGGVAGHSFARPPKGTVPSWLAALAIGDSPLRLPPAGKRPRGYATPS